MTVQVHPDEGRPVAPAAALPAPGRVIERALAFAAAALLCGMVLLITGDVVGRTLFALPVPGTYELMSMMLAALIFIGLPLATERDEHVVVDLVDHALPRAAVRGLTLLASILSALALAGLAWAMARQGFDQLAAGGTTSQLRLPLAPVAFLMSAASLLSALALLARMARRG